MKLKVVLNKLLTNSWVLKIVFITSLVSVLSYIVLGNIDAFAFFVVMAALIRYFSRNMIIILGVPLILVNLYVLNKSNKNNKEGLENNNDSGSNTNLAKKASQAKVIDKLNSEKRTQDSTPITPPIIGSKTDESFEVGRPKKGGAHDIDYASTIEDAYDELNKILGSDGIKRLTDDTQGLMKQQAQLAESMKGMAPLIQGMAPMMKQAQAILGDMGNDKEGLGSIMNMAKKLAGGASS
jgi:hypothetical protein